MFTDLSFSFSIWSFTFFPHVFLRYIKAWISKTSENELENANICPELSSLGLILDNTRKAIEYAN